MSLQSATEELDSLLQSSVSEHLLSDVPLGVWLSGGLDSSTILHYASQASSSKIKTFSISFRGRSFDESSYIGKMVEEYGTEHEELDLNPTDQDLEGAIQEFAYYSDEPSADAGALPLWFLAKLSRTQTEVALSGEGADELFGGYLTYRASRIAANMRRLPSAALRLGQGLMQLWPVSDDKIALEYKIKRLLAGSLMSAERGTFFGTAHSPITEKRQLVADQLPLALDDVLARPSRPAWTQRQRPECVPVVRPEVLPARMIFWLSRIASAWPTRLRCRPAFLDHRIVEFANRLPASFKVSGSRQKIVLQQLMSNKLPAGHPAPAQGRLRHSRA